MRVTPTNKRIIIILSVVLAISAIALIGIWLYRGSGVTRTSQTVTVPDNTISNASTGWMVYARAEETTTECSLYFDKAEEVVPFKAINMFPGDTETKSYTVKVSHNDDVTLRFRATVRDGYELLAEVLHCRLLCDGAVQYDGLMRDMPQSLSEELAAGDAVTTERTYTVTTYLDTTVGNAYQDASLVADFRWWVEETEHLIPPQTGESDVMWIWVAVIGGIAFLCIIVLCRRRRDAK